MSIRVAILDDHELVAAGVGALLAHDVADVDVTWFGVSAREPEVLRRYAQGLPLKAISRRLDLTESTCNEYLKRARRKYQEQGRSARTRAERIRRAIEDEFLDPAAAGGAHGGDPLPSRGSDRTERE